MPQFPSASHLGHRFLEFFKTHHGDEMECRGTSQFLFRRMHHELILDVHNALDDLSGLHGSEDGNEVIKIPKCMYDGSPCDRHCQIYRCFIRTHDSETSGNHRTKPVPPRTEPDLFLAGTDVESNRDDRDGEGFSSRDCTDHSGRLFGDSLDHDLDAKSSGDLDSTEDDENGFLPSVDAMDAAGYDREEVVQKHEVSQRLRQRIVVDDDDVRTLVSVSDDELPAESMSGPMQSGMVAQTDHATLNNAEKHSVDSPFTPKNTVPSLQRPNDTVDTHSARKKIFYGHYENSPGPRTLKTVNTLSVDQSYDQDISTNEEAVRRRIMRPLMPRGDDSSFAEAGFVYALRDNELPSLKSATQQKF